jgi:hypothetical protein
MLLLMIFNEMPLEEMDFTDESFRISEELDSAALMDSLRAVGQLNPACVLEGYPQMTIVCGFRRLRALRRLGNARALVRILPRSASDLTPTFNLALWDNLSHRQLNPLEKARVLAGLKDICGVPEELLLETYLPVLGLKPSADTLLVYLSLNGLHPDLRKCLIDGRLTQSSAEKLAEIPLESQARFAELMSRIRLSASSQRKVLSLLSDLAAIGRVALTEPLRHPEVLSAVDDPRLSPFQKGERIYEALYRLRNPRLSRAAEQFSARKQMLGLPGSIQITGDPFFEVPGLRVQFDASSADRFRDLTAALQKASSMPALEELFEI